MVVKIENGMVKIGTKKFFERKTLFKVLSAFQSFLDSRQINCELYDTGVIIYNQNYKMYIDFHPLYSTRIQNIVLRLIFKKDLKKRNNLKFEDFVPKIFYIIDIADKITLLEYGFKKEEDKEEYYRDIIAKYEIANENEEETSYPCRIYP